MLNISHNIQVGTNEECYIIIGIIKRQYIDKPVFIVHSESGYSISFESNYEEYEMINQMQEAFSEYDCIEWIGLGLSDIRIIAERTQDMMSTDDWGRPLERNDNKTFYFVKKDRATMPPQLPNKTVKVLLGKTEEKEFNINVAQGMNPDTEEKGFIVIKDRIEGRDCELILNKLFKSKSEAFWGGYREIERTIEKQYEDYKESQKRKRKNKQSFEDWLKKWISSEGSNKTLLSADELLSLKKGDKVFHTQFGSGYVVNLEGDNLETMKSSIDFQSGRKTLVLKYAPLHKEKS